MAKRNYQFLDESCDELLTLLRSKIQNGTISAAEQALLFKAYESAGIRVVPLTTDQPTTRLQDTTIVGDDEDDLIPFPVKKSQ